jgi:hypothetical protein
MQMVIGLAMLILSVLVNDRTVVGPSVEIECTFRIMAG